MYTLMDLDTIDSTNAFAKRKLTDFRDDGPTIIKAREQSSGRGRFGHSWISPKDQNLYLTLAEPRRRELQLVQYSYAATHAIINVLKSYGIAPQVRWPNDLLVDGKKICGILVEGTSKGSQPWAIVGIGLNVNMDKALLAAIERPATSLQAVLHHAVSVDTVQQQTIDALLAALAWACEDPRRCQQQYLALCSWMEGTVVSVHTTSGVVKGVVEGWTEDGFLLLRTNDGTVLPVPQGVVAH